MPRFSLASEIVLVVASCFGRGRMSSVVLLPWFSFASAIELMVVGCFPVGGSLVIELLDTSVKYATVTFCQRSTGGIWP